ncbi:hypothetical protein CAP36_01375 [Chitinophagaceae bacterium IBVUCB2]|nr:hypothetical protein CAP36_01375 [Chitinophagaceae bacterium IBVUCB2]
MKKGLLILALLLSFYSQSQSVFGYWYGYANVKTNSSANNYLVELVLQPEKNYVTGILNYYFKNTYRSIKVKGDFNKTTRQLSLYDIPIVYFGSIANFEVDCIMNMQASLRVAQAGSNLVGAFVGLPDYKYTCADIRLNLTHNADISKKDSVLKAISEYKENIQVWTPSYDDTLVSVDVVPRKVVNYVTEKQYTERENIVISEIEVDSDSLQVDVYDNGEIDGDMISLFYNKQLILSNQKLTHKSIKIKIELDSTKAANEISMFAENLGLIPPNTALMIVNDGKNKHEIRLTSSLEKNATIRIRRRKLQ